SYSTHMLVCSRDLEMATCTAKAADLAFGSPQNWIFHDDGSLSQLEVRTLREQLPGCIVATRREADQRAEDELSDFPRILEYRRNQVMALKLVDVALWSRGSRTCYIDSDVLFFRRPEFFIEALDGTQVGNYFNRDIHSAYVRTPEEIESCLGILPRARLNAGLWVLWTKDIDLDTIEKWLNHSCFEDHLYAYTLDQTFISMLATISDSGVDYLPPDYDVSFHKDVSTSVNKHYVGAIRHGYELEGLAYLLQQRDLASRWGRLSSEVVA
ncbi:MAG: hypothetical protein KJO98_07360, partial [Rhodothermia bacterium]|nr:hypothetical protein [Rhodothermia bacterium]